MPRPTNPIEWTKDGTIAFVHIMWKLAVLGAVMVVLVTIGTFVTGTRDDLLRPYTDNPHKESWQHVPTSVPPSTRTSSAPR